MMKTSSHMAHTILVMLAIFLSPRPAWAYIGPGAGLSAIGAFVGLIAGVIVALFGFIWYPVKRVLRMRRQRKRRRTEGGE
jgi:hypothetical protein